MSQAKSKLPPGPKSFKILGSLNDLKQDPLAFLSNLRHEYGDIAMYRAGTKRVVQLAHPDLIRDLLVTDSGKYRKTGLMQQARPILGNGLFLSEGEEHRKQRRIVQPAFARQRIEEYAPVVVEVASRFADRLQHGQRLDMADEMLELALSIVSRAMFNIDLDEEAERLRVALTVVIEHFRHFLRPGAGLRKWLPTAENRRFEGARRTLDSAVYRMIHEARGDTSKRRGVLDMLLAAQESDDPASRMPDKLLRDEVMTLFVAGHETVATALTWTWYLLAKHPEVEARLGEEWAEVCGERRPIAADLSRLKYTEMVLAESMRIFPPVWAVSRRLEHDHELGGYQLPAGTIVGISQYVTHRDARFFPEPERFDPLRWTPGNRATRPKYSYFPFGGGPRLCVGEPFAWMEMILVLATVGRRWRCSYDEPNAPSLLPRVTLRPKHGMPMLIKGSDAHAIKAHSSVHLASIG